MNDNWREIPGRPGWYEYVGPWPRPMARPDALIAAALANARKATQTPNK